MPLFIYRWIPKECNHTGCAQQQPVFLRDGFWTSRWYCWQRPPITGVAIAVDSLWAGQSGRRRVLPNTLAQCMQVHGWSVGTLGISFLLWSNHVRLPEKPWHWTELQWRRCLFNALGCKAFTGMATFISRHSHSLQWFWFHYSSFCQREHSTLTLHCGSGTGLPLIFSFLGVDLTACIYCASSRRYRSHQLYCWLLSSYLRVLITLTSSWMGSNII